ncbi:MAG: hypothetical protein FRX49_07296 [Trebouxia sp. A1-2]|nr:MAG: hypothetical protein FRX49_07296 [Trebouxia sp. A1-2]
MADETTGVSILETASYIIALVFLSFLVLFVAFEKFLEWRREQLRKHHKVGLLAALEAVQSEIMLFGLASLLLNLFEGPIVHAPSSSTWTILSQLNGCPCCLRNTKQVSDCWLEGEGCGSGLCNCNDADPSCLVNGEAGERRLLSYSPMMGTRGLLQDSSASDECMGIHEYSQAECGYRPGYTQALSGTAIHQARQCYRRDNGYVLIRVSTARVKIWRHWLAEDDAHSKAVHKALQQHTLKKPIASKANANDETVVDIGDDGTAHDLQQKPSLLTRLASKAGLVSDSAHEEKTSASTGLIGNASQTMLTDSETNNADSPADEIMLTDPQSHEPESPHDLPVEASGSTEAVPALQHAQRQLANSHTVASDQKDKKSNRSHVPGRLDRDIAYMLWHSKHKRASQLRRAVPRRSNQQDDAQPANDQQERLKPANDQLDESQALHAADSGGVQLPGEKASLPGAEGNSQRAEGSFSGAARNALGAKGSVHGAEGTMYMNDELLAEQKAAPEVTSKTSNSKTGAQHEKHLPDEVLVEQAKHWAGRQHVIARRRGYGREWMTCFVRQFCLQTIQHAEISIMRASFILTHRPGKKFHFMDYILASMDDDCAKVVGLGPTVWLVVVVFALLSGVIGWASAWFELLAVILILTMNTKLIYIARHTARGGAAHRLKPTIFWFGAKGPWVMLTVIKTLLFLCSFIFASSVFFAIYFGPKSCFFAYPGLNSASLPVPWFVVLIANAVVYLALSFITVPLYSLGVQMGSDFRPHIFSPDVKDRLLQLASANKEKVRQRKLQEAGSGSGSSLGLGSSHGNGNNRSKSSNSKYKKLANGISVHRLLRKRKIQH